MSYSTVNYRDVDAVADAMHFLREPLDCKGLGLTVVECPPGWTGKRHDHAEGGHEEVYLLVDGEASIEINGEEVAVAPGDAVRVAPDASRQVRNGDSESMLVIAGVP